MTAAVFKATYADWKVVKTRGVVQVVFEVPLSDHDTAYQTLGGMPDPARERWFGVARLNPEAKEETTENSFAETRPRPSLPPQAGGAKSYAQEAGRLCGDVRFQKFCEEINRGLPVRAPARIEPRHWDIDRPTATAMFVRNWCRVKSRADINASNFEAVEAWLKLVTGYELERVA